MAPGLGRFDSEPPATSERTTLLKDVREPGALREIFGLNGVTRNLIRHLRLDKLNQRGGLPLRLPGEPSRRRPQDRSHPHPYRKPLNPSPRLREPTRVRHPQRPPLPTAWPRPTRCEDSRRKRGRNGPTVPTASDAGTLAGNLSFRRKCQFRLKRSRRRFLTPRSILRRRHAPIRLNRRPA
jgi:hypothetical protein